MLIESDEEEEPPEEEEKKEQPLPEEEDDGWTRELRDIEVPLPRLRHLQNRAPPADITPMQLFQYFIPLGLMEEFAHHTNAAAPHEWRHTTAQELYAFLGVHLFMGIDRLPRTEMYWSAGYQHSTITSIFSRDRFKEGIHLLSVPELGITTRISHPCVVIVLCAAARAALHASKQTTFATRVACTYALAIVSLFTTADCKPSDCHIHVLLYDSNSLVHDLN